MDTKDINQWISRCGGLTSHRNKLKKMVLELENQIKSNTFMTHCSFCGRPAEDVFYLVVGPRVSICNDCTITAVASMNDILTGDKMPMALENESCLTTE